MLDNLPFDPRLLAGVQSSLMPAAETPPPANTDLPPEADQPTAPSTQQPQPNGEAAKANPDTGRDARGKFTKGNFGGPGNPFARQTAAFRKAINAAVAALLLRYVVPALDATQRQMVVDEADAQDRKAAEKSEKKHGRKTKRHRREDSAAGEDAPESHRQQREPTCDTRLR